MSKIKNPVWRFFASVKLALIALIILAATSIIGTLIKQGQPPSYYVEEYGPKLARLFETLSIPNMYSSWWFVVLLSLFATNLIVCSIERLPSTWRMVVLDNLTLDPEQLEKMGSTHRANTSSPAGAAADQMSRLMEGAGWKKLRRLERNGSFLLFAQKGAWTRLGVYVVHLSILIILIGVMIGNFFGFQAYVYLPEGRSTNVIFLRDSKEPMALGFDLQADRYEKTLYPNGMVKEYRADLSVFDLKGGSPYQKSIIVNDPLTYGGLTFYLGDSFPLDEYFVVIRNRATGMEEAFRVPPATDAGWQGTDISFRIEDLKRDEDGAVRQARIRLVSGNSAEPSVFWIGDKATVNIGRPGEDFTFSFRQLYATLLLVKKDPGVWTLFSGCGLMLAGLAISLFMSHRRIWVHITPSGKQGSQIQVSGTCNKNKSDFERRFQDLVARVRQDMSIPPGKK